jgi:hypothetical protein
MTVYAIAEYSDVPYIEAGKRYEVSDLRGGKGDEYGRNFYIDTDGAGPRYCLERGCAHIDDHNWKLVDEKGEPV